MPHMEQEGFENSIKELVRQVAIEEGIALGE